MLASLPAPTREYVAPQAPVAASTALVGITRKEPPPYGSTERARYIPRRQEDYGDGGAFPEVQVAQFPLDMGKKGLQSGVGSSSGKDTTLAVTVGADGEVNYDSILRQGRNKDKIIYSDHKALVPKIDALREVSKHFEVVEVLTADFPVCSTHVAVMHNALSHGLCPCDRRTWPQ